MKTLLQPLTTAIFMFCKKLAAFITPWNTITTEKQQSAVAVIKNTIINHHTDPLHPGSI